MPPLPPAAPERRILLWYWGRRGAGGQMTLALAEALARQPGVRVALAISAQAELRAELEALGLPIEALPTYASAAGFALGFLRLPWLAWRLRRQARHFRADAVVSVMTHLWTPLVAPVLNRSGLRYLPFIHDAAPHPGDPGWLWDWRLNTELDAASAAIALSDAVAATLRQRRPGLPVHRLALGAHLPRAWLDHPAAARPPGGEAPRFLLFGRLRAYKGLDLLRDAWPLLRSRCPDAALHIIGEGDPEALAPGLAALPGVRVEARWLAEAEIPTLIAAADAVVLPYREASQSGVVALAYALGVPAVVTPVGGLAEQVRDGIDGAVASATTPAALADAMARLCPPAERARLAAGAAATGLALRDWGAQARALLGALDSAAPLAPVPRPRDRS
jgi:glycosyltransferase involved in cell wall biosynthesis